MTTLTLIWDAGPNKTRTAQGSNANYYLAKGPYYTSTFVCVNGSVTTTCIGRTNTVEEAKELAERHANEVTQ
jgi:hypothetical protein